MNPDLSRTLAELASKLGTTADRLWPVLVAQAKLSALIAMWATGSVEVFAILLLIFFTWLLFAKDSDTSLGVGGILITLVVLVVVGFITCDTYVDYRFPEAAALQRLLHQ